MGVIVVTIMGPSGGLTRSGANDDQTDQSGVLRRRRIILTLSRKEHRKVGTERDEFLDPMRLNSRYRHRACRGLDHK